MLPEDADVEIEKLKTKKIEMTNRMNAADDYDERENIKESIKKIDNQIRLIEKLKGR